MKILNLGCGREPVAGAVTVDQNKSVSPDVCHDLNIYPWPFENASFDEIHARDILEHLEDVVKAMEEIHRIARPGARVIITTPHFSCANSYTDPTHRHHLGFFSFDYFTGENQWDFYSDKKFKKKKAFLYFYPGLAGKILWRLANRWPEFYEKKLTWIFPAWFMHFELEVIKP